MDKQSLTAYVFDLDGTLVPSSKEFESKEHHDMFIRFCAKYPTFIVTGAEYQAVCRQVGQKIINFLKGVYSCCGNDYRCQGNEVHVRDFPKPTNPILVSFSEILNNHPHLQKTNNTHLCDHVRYRAGMINFSIAGHSASDEERKSYVEYDETHNDRNIIAERLQKQFGHIFDFRVAGQTGIDITENGHDKGQIYHSLRQNYDRVVFFCDGYTETGNDYPLIIQCTENDKIVRVDSHNETFEVLKGYL